MLGGGTFTSLNAVLPGSYINFVSAARAAEVSGRGRVAIPFEMDWCEENKVFEVTKADFEKNAQVILGYPVNHAKMKNFREAFKGAKVLLCYRLNHGGVKASNDFATARYTGARGNDLKIIITANVDVPASFDVKTMLGDVLIDSQTVATAAGLVGNDFVDFKAGATLALTAGTALTGGTNGAAVVGADYTTYLGAIESHSFNALAYPGGDDTTAQLFDNFTKRMRDELGIKFQLVRLATATAPDHEGVIVVPNAVLDDGAPTGAIIYWVAGAQSACEINESLTNAEYTGEYTVDVNYRQTQLMDFVKAGKLAFHKVGQDVRILTDINSFTSFTELKTKGFSSNQSIRVLDQIGNDVAALFNTKYLGKIPGTDSGRSSLWSDAVTYHQGLEKQGAIQDFVAQSVTVEQGETRKQVVMASQVTPTECMEQLYSTVYVA